MMIDLDLAGVPAEALQRVLLPLATMRPGGAWEAVARALAWAAVAEIRRRRAGEAPAPIPVDLAAAAELTPGEREVMVGLLERLAAEWRSDGLRALAAAIAAGAA